MSKNNEKKVLPKFRFPEFGNEGEWKTILLGQISEFINGRAYKQEELLSEGKYKVLRVGNFFTNNEWYYSNLELDDDKYCNDGDLLYAWSASFGPKIWVGEKVIYHYHIWKVKNSTIVTKEFLFNLLDFESQRIKSKSANGFALLHITKGTIENWESHIPKSVKEQQKIAACLSSLDDLITAENQKLETLKAHKNGLLQNLFPAEGETLPKLRFKEFEGSGEWEENTLGNIGSFTGGGTPSKSVDSFWEGEIPWISSSDIDEESIHGVEITRFISKEALESSATKLVPENSILLVSRVGVGKLAVSKTKICTSQDFTSLTPLNDNVYFIAYYIKSKTNILIGYSQGMAIKGFTKEDISKFCIYLPSILEQQKIANLLSSLDKMILSQNQRLEVLKTHKKGLLQGLFPNTTEITA